MAKPIEWRALAVVLLGASVCLGKGRTPIDGTGAAARSGDLAIRGDGDELGRLAETPDHGPLLKADGESLGQGQLPGRALRFQAACLPT